LVDVCFIRAITTTTTTTTATTANTTGNNTCFPHTSFATLQNGNKIPMSELKVGTIIKILTEQGNVEYAPMPRWLHRMEIKAGQSVPATVLRTHPNATISSTADHYIPVGRGKILNPSSSSKN